MLGTMDRDPITGNAVVAKQALPSISIEALTSEGVPEGYDTVSHWWASMEAEALELLSDPLATFYRASEDLQTLCEERGLDFYWVPAAPAFQAVGLQSARAFPKTLLTEFYPTNP